MYFAIILLAYVPAIPTVTWLSNQYNKLTTYYICFGVGLVGLIWCMTYDEGDVWLFAFNCLFCGFAAGGWSFMFFR